MRIITRRDKVRIIPEEEIRCVFDDHVQVNLVIARIDITRIRIQHDLVLDPIFFPKPPFFPFYNMNSSHIEKKICLTGLLAR